VAAKQLASHPVDPSQCANGGIGRILIVEDRRICAMNVSVIDRPGETVGHNLEVPTDDIRQMTTAQFRRLGVRSLVYLRAGMLNGEMAYAIHAADGIPMAVVDDVDSAVALACEHGMAFVAVH